MFLHLSVIPFTRGSLFRGSLSRRSLSGGDLCPGGLCPGGLCPEGSLSRGVSDHALMFHIEKVLIFLKLHLTTIYNS